MLRPPQPACSSAGVMTGDLVLTCSCFARHALRKSVSEWSDRKVLPSMRMDRKKVTSHAAIE